MPGKSAANLEGYIDRCGLGRGVHDEVGRVKGEARKKPTDLPRSPRKIKMSHKMVPFGSLASRLHDISVESSDVNPIIVPEPKKSPLIIGRPCKYCPDIDLESNEEFRKHYQTDWHNKNQELALKGRKPLSFEEYELLVSMESSSDSDFWDEDSDEQDGDMSDDESLGPVNPMINFLIEKNKFGVYRKLLFGDKNEYRSTVVTTEVLRTFMEEACQSTWAIFLIKSGRLFAGIFDVAKGKFIRSKVMKKYTERRKQGGSQLLRDKSGKVGRSAGSQLRRKNETDLLADIEQLLTDWKEELDKCQLIWWNKTFFSQIALFQGKVLPKDDARLRLIPFTTYKPCEEEAIRCLNLLASAHPAK